VGGTAVQVSHIAREGPGSFIPLSAPKQDKATKGTVTLYFGFSRFGRCQATLQKHHKRIGQRRGEDKMAAYYDPVAFRPIDSFPAELESRGYERLATAMSECPIKFIDGKDEGSAIDDIFFNTAA
jgi:hypothetical protein